MVGSDNERVRVFVVVWVGVKGADRGTGGCWVGVKGGFVVVGSVSGGV